MSKNQEKLESLTTFLNNHPELRFWQRLLAWAKEYYGNEHSSPDRIYVNSTDTFYWE